MGTHSVALVDTNLALIRDVLVLAGTARGDPNYWARREALLDQCRFALDACKAALRAPPAVATLAHRKLATGELGVRIAELRAGGMGVRAIARSLNVAASTVSRRLPKAGKA